VTDRPRILVIRRDNIGDLVCTTPLIAALRARFPEAGIVALVNSYNAPVLAGNPDVSEVCAYTKLKHRGAHESVARILWNRMRLLSRLRTLRFDYAILAGAPFLPQALKFARRVGVRHIVGYTDPVQPAARHIDLGLPGNHLAGRHEVELTFDLLQPLGISGPPGGLVLIPDPRETERARAALVPGSGPVIGIHVSARKPSQRWPAARFAELLRRICNHSDMRFMVFWAPGSETDPRHPGDDEAARSLLSAVADVPVTAYATTTLPSLIGGLAACNRVVCSDGGAMHLAAALGKPLLCFFGQSDVTRWRPWGVPHVILQAPSRSVVDVSVDEAVSGFAQLTALAGAPHAARVSP
jgi:ADP-heptose:LPS heptosyltransferase